MIWELAGVLGVDPGRLTLRELDTMASAKFDHDWSQTALLATLLFNAHKPKGVRRAKPEDYNPWAKQRKKKQQTAQPPVSGKAAWLGFKKDFLS